MEELAVLVLHEVVILRRSLGNLYVLLQLRSFAMLVRSLVKMGWTGMR